MKPIKAKIFFDTQDPKVIGWNCFLYDGEGYQTDSVWLLTIPRNEPGKAIRLRTMRESTLFDLFYLELGDWPGEIEMVNVEIRRPT
jgi:hypothetical protein